MERSTSGRARRAGHTAPPASDVPSPCLNLCRMNPGTGWCSGCWRTLDEIAAWSTLSDDDKRRVWAALPARRAEHAPQTTEPDALLRRITVNPSR